MQILNQQRHEIPVRLLKNQQGVSILAVIFVILVLTAIGYTFSAMMASKQKSVPATLDGTRAFHIAEGGLHYAGNYLGKKGNWGSLVGSPPAELQNVNLGGGNFSVSFSGHTSGPPERINAISTGTYGMATRLVRAAFER